jgi:hypothetical protein
MKIFQPYEELADTLDTLHLKLSDARERMLFTLFRVAPIAIFLFVWLVLQQVAQRIPMGFNYLFILIVAASIIFLLFRSYITEIKIAAGNVFLVQKTITGTREVNIPSKEVGHVILRKGKAGGVEFILFTKTKQRFTLLHIPPVWVDEKHTLLIEETLRLLLHVEIKRQ